MPNDTKILNELHPELKKKVLEILKHVNAPGKLPPGISLHPQCGYRSEKAQLEAYNAGRSKLKRGKHNLWPSRAVDLVWWVEGNGWSWDASMPWWLLGYWAEENGLGWGGRWGTPQPERKVKAHDGMRLGWDAPHVELKSWK